MTRATWQRWPTWPRPTAPRRTASRRRQHPAARRHRLHVGARLPSVLQASDREPAVPGISSVPPRAARPGNQTVRHNQNRAPAGVERAAMHEGCVPSGVRTLRSIAPPGAEVPAFRAATTRDSRTGEANRSPEDAELRRMSAHCYRQYARMQLLAPFALDVGAQTGQRSRGADLVRVRPVAVSGTAGRRG